MKRTPEDRSDKRPQEAYIEIRKAAEMKVLPIALIGAGIATLGAGLPALAQQEDARASNQQSKTGFAPPELGLGIPENAFQGARSREILIVQVLLDRSPWSPGVVDGYAGGNTRRAINAFKAANNLDPNGEIDNVLLDRLNGDGQAPILKKYKVTPEDTEGPFKPVPDSMAAMAKQDALGYASAEELLAEKFHMTPGLLRALNPEADFDATGTEIIVIDAGDESLKPTVARIEVDRAGSELRAYDAEGVLVSSYPATVGSSEFPSPSGTMQVSAIAAAPTYHFQPEDQDWGGDKQLTLPAGPNNPVGSTWIDLGKNGYGIHGAPEPSDIGKTASHGCVRLTNWDAAELAKAVSPGSTQVVFK